MSVVWHVRSISDALHDKLGERPEIATRLALEHEAVDFERTTFLAANAQPKAQEWAAKRAGALEKEHAAAWSALADAGVRRSDIDVALEVGKPGNGLRWSFEGSVVTLFDERGGVPIGDDVGYGPSRLFSPSEITTMYDAMLALPLATFASQYERAAGREHADPYVTFEGVVGARVRLAAYLKTSKVSWRAALVWAD